MDGICGIIVFMDDNNYDSKRDKISEKSKFSEIIVEKINAINVWLKRTWEKIDKNCDHTHDGELFIERTKPRPFLLACIFTTIKIFIVLVLLIGCAGVGLVLGVAKAYIDTTPELDIASLTKSDRSSFIYDMNGNLITTFAGIEYRDWVEIEDVPDMLVNALIAIEDVRFYKHEGVDYKRLFSAVINTLRNANAHGGSTLTQQLVKNKLLSNEQSYKRKIQEAYLALEVEKVISKEDILEAYLNDVYLGESNYGVKTAANDYFGKDLSALTIRECAMLAGMVQKPYETDPRANMYKRTYKEGEKAGQNKMDITDARTDLVIERMYEAGFITSEQRNKALSDTVKILETSQQKQVSDMLYFVEYGIRDVVTALLEQRELPDTKSNRSMIENELRTSAYHIYLTVDSTIQHTVQDTLSTWDKYPQLANPSAAEDVVTNADGTTTTIIQPQSAAVILDYHTGELRAIIGGRDEPTMQKQWNRAYQSTLPVGSSIKPIAVYGPAFDLGLNPASVILNFPSAIEGWGEGSNGSGYPAIGAEKWIGPVTVRRGIVSSLNVVAARTLFEHVTVATSREYLINLGVDPSRINADGPGLALGTTGITPIEMAAAYGAIANGGVYNEPLAFSRVVDDGGRIILDADDVRDTHRVFKTSTAMMLVDVLENAVESGTGTKAKIEGITVAGKTGTNNDYSSAYFAGITPYYVGTVWVGHDEYKYKLADGSTGGAVAAPLWQSFMEKIHDGLIDKPIIDIPPSEAGLVKCEICSVSGKLATDACRFDADGRLPVTEWVAKDNMPTEICDMHVIMNICQDSGQPASPYCPYSSVVAKSVVLVSSTSKYAAIDPIILQKYMTNVLYTDVTVEQFATAQFDSSAMCRIHGYWSGADADTLVDIAISNAQALVSEINAYINSVQNLPETHLNTLKSGVQSLQYYVSFKNATTIERNTEQLRYNFETIKAEYPPVAGP